MNAATAEVIPFPETPLDDGGDGGDAGPEFLAEFMLRLGLRLDEEDAETRDNLRGIVLEVLQHMAEEEGNEHGRPF